MSNSELKSINEEKAFNKRLEYFADELYGKNDDSVENRGTLNATLDRILDIIVDRVNNYRNKIKLKKTDAKNAGYKDIFKLVDELDTAGPYESLFNYTLDSHDKYFANRLTYENNENNEIFIGEKTDDNKDGIGVEINKLDDIFIGYWSSNKKDNGFIIHEDGSFEKFNRSIISRAFSIFGKRGGDKLFRKQKTAKRNSRKHNKTLRKHKK
jgi:hypothetical protein